eukprot:4027091-Pleurochrysis_carterae.AAC.1
MRVRPQAHAGGSTANSGACAWVGTAAARMLAHQRRHLREVRARTSERGRGAARDGASAAADARERLRIDARKGGCEWRVRNRWALARAPVRTCAVARRCGSGCVTDARSLRRARPRGQAQGIVADMSSAAFPRHS